MIKFTNWRHYEDAGATIDCEIDGDELTEEEYEYLEKNNLINLIILVGLEENTIDNDGSLLFNIRIINYSGDTNETIFEKLFKKINEETIEEVNSFLGVREIEDIELTLKQFLNILGQNDY